MIAQKHRLSVHTNDHTGFSATCVCSCTPLYLLASSATSLNIFSLLNSAPRAIFSMECLHETSASLYHARDTGAAMHRCMQCSFCTSCALFVGQEGGTCATCSAKGCVMKWSCRRQCFPEHLRQPSGVSFQKLCIQKRMVWMFPVSAGMKREQR